VEFLKEQNSNMNNFLKTLVISSIAIPSLMCSSQKEEAFKPTTVYKSEDLVITQVSENAFIHMSFLQTNDFGNVPCNGLFVRSANEVIVFDTPTSDRSSEALIHWIKETLHAKINAIIPTHFHDDCLGELQAFHNNAIPFYAYYKTIELARENGFVVPANAFRDSLVLPVGKETISARYFGEGHTKDNVVVYFPGEHVLFGGCLIKEINASKGYLGDANVAAWSHTVENVKNAYPQVKIVVPGHGDSGNKELLDYTIGLFKPEL
jgi:metallo-beta-lactamase class B